MGTVLKRNLRSHRTGNKSLNRTDVRQAAVWVLQPTGLDPLPGSTDSIKVKSGKLIRQVDEVRIYMMSLWSLLFYCTDLLCAVRMKPVKVIY